MSAFLWIAGFILAALFVFILILFLRERYKEEDFLDYTLIVNFLPQYTQGFSRGILLSIDKGDTRDGYTFLPKDIDYLRRIKNKEKLEIKPLTIFIEKDKILHLPRGTLSAERSEIWLFPPTPEDLPKSLLKSDFGKAFAKMIEEDTVEKNVIDIMRKRNNLQDELLNRVEGMDVVKDFIRVSRELDKDFAKKVLDLISDKKTTSSGYMPPSHSNISGGM